MKKKDKKIVTDSKGRNKRLSLRAGKTILEKTYTQREYKARFFLKEKKETCAATRNYIRKEERAATRPIAARSVHKVLKKKKNEIRIRDAIRFPTTFSKRYTGPRITVEQQRDVLIRSSGKREISLFRSERRISI